MITGLSQIGLEKSEEKSNSFKTYNVVADCENDWVIYDASREEVSKACLLASNAFEEYQLVSVETRAKFLRLIASNIEALGDDLLKVYCAESSLSMERARAERLRTCNQLRMFADFIESGSINEVKTFESDLKALHKSYRPIGPIVVFGSSNFPFAYSTMGGDSSSALAAGCPVIVKNHPMHAGTGELVSNAVIDAAREVGLPNGVFSNLNGRGIDLGEQLVLNEHIKGIGFTGSINGGRAIYNLAATRPEPIPVFAEMGSTNPVVLGQKTISAEHDKWVDLYSKSIALDGGQFCTSPGIFIGIESESLSLFARDLATALDDEIPQPMLHPNIANSYVKRRQEVLSNEHVQLLTNNEDVRSNYVNQGLAIVKAEDFLMNLDLQEEVFGSFALIVSCNSEEERKAVVKKLHGQLTGTVIATAEEQKQISETIHLLSTKVGRLIFNDVSTGVIVEEAQNHGGPYPASSDSRFTAVGTDSIYRWLRSVVVQHMK